VLVSGPRGVGKRSLVQSLQLVVEADGGLFLSSCCCYSSLELQAASTSSDGKKTADDQPLQSGGASTRSVFFDVVGNLLNHLTDDQLQMVRDKLLPTYFANPTEFQLLCDILSPMERFSEHIMRDDDDHDRPSAKVYHETTRFTTAPTISTNWSATTTTALKSNSLILARFVSAISTLLPLVVSLDHVEHAALDDLSALIDLQSWSISSKGLLVLLLYNSDVDQAAPIQTILSLQDQTSVGGSNGDRRFKPERCVATPVEVVLCNLMWDDTYEWIEEWSAGSIEYQVLNERLQALTDFVQEETMGHPQHIHFLLAWLKHDGVLSKCWFYANDTWLAQVKHRAPPSVSALFQQVCQAQTSLVQGVVETAAAILKCSPSSLQFAPTVTCHILEMVLQRSCRDALAVLVECGLLNCYSGRCYRFN
jgi:hypothetical protein